MNEYRLFVNSTPTPKQINFRVIFFLQIKIVFFQRLMPSMPLACQIEIKFEA